MIKIWDKLIGQIICFIYAVRFKGHRRVIKAIYPLISGNKIMSVYGIWLEKNLQDATFRFSAYGDYDNTITNIIDNITEEVVFLDIGANTGLFSFIAEKNKHIKACYTFEPNQKLFAKLEKNKHHNNSHANLLNFGISDKNGTASFECDDNHSGKGKIVSETTKSQTIEVQDYSALDKISKAYKHEKFFIKIDVEGHEAVVMEQLRKSQLFGRCSGIIIEIDERRLTKENIERIKEIMIECGLTDMQQLSTGCHYDLYFSGPSK